MDNIPEPQQHNRFSINSFQDILQDILKDHVDQTNVKELIFSSNLPLVDQLIIELCKPTSYKKKFEDDKLERNLAKIEILIKLLPDFKKLIDYNRIDDKSLRIASRNMKYIKITSGTYIFNQGDISDVFYCIIQGKVSLRKTKTREIINQNFIPYSTSNSNRTILLTEEEEILQLTEGQYFGEWGIIDEKPRLCSAYTVEDCDFFIIDKRAFINSIGKCMANTESEKKKFLVKIIRSLSNMSSRKFNEVYKNFTHKCYLKNEFVYKEGNIGEKIYIIYEGNFMLTQAKNQSIVKQNKLYNSLDYSIIMRLNKEDISGIEIIDKDTYNFTLISDSELSSVIEINIKKINEELKNLILTSLKSYIKKKKEIESELLENHTYIKSEEKVIYREYIINKYAKNKKSKKDEDREQKQVNQYVNDAKKVKYNIQNKPSCIIINKLNSKALLTKLNKLKNNDSKYRPSSTVPNSSRYNKKEDYNNKLINKDKIINVQNNLYTSDNTYSNKINYSGLKSNICSLSTNINSERALSSKRVVSGYLNNQVKKRFIEKINENRPLTSSIAEHKVNKLNRNIVNKLVSNNLEKWNSIQKNNVSSYSTGNLLLPLVTQMCNL